MDIKNMLQMITNACIYYYKIYHNDILNDSDICLPNHLSNTMNCLIYNSYINQFRSNDIYDILLLNPNMSYIYKLDSDIITQDDLFTLIYFWVNNMKFIYDSATPDINIIALGNNPIDDYMYITHEWIIRSIDLYIY